MKEIQLLFFSLCLTMLIYFLFGNSFDDPTNIWERITNSYEGDTDGQACY